VELSNANVDPDSLLSALHAERETAAEETRRKQEQEEDDAMVAQYFAKIPATAPEPKLKGKDKGKGKEKAIPEAEEEGSNVGSGSEEEDGDTGLPAALTIKRRPAPGTGGPAEPSVATLLAERAKALNGSSDNPTPSTSGGVGGAAQAKRKREGMQKLLGIKKKK
jgi:hypothetical protein